MGKTTENLLHGNVGFMVKFQMDEACFLNSRKVYLGALNKPRHAVLGRTGEDWFPTDVGLVAAFSNI